MMPQPQNQISSISRSASEDLRSCPINAWLGEPLDVKSQVDSKALLGEPSKKYAWVLAGIILIYLSLPYF